jgi:predicted transcriptional regulator/predicted RNA-binding Zn-ribbon protein involved in translation (DUF1610 family)
MSKITFRADDDLVNALDAFDASKSEVMRRALRSYLDEHTETDVNASETLQAAENPLDEALAERVQRLVDQALPDDIGGPAVRAPRGDAQDINVTVSVDGLDAAENAGSGPESGADVDVRKTAGNTQDNVSDTAPVSCGQCGESVRDDHAYCPNCGEHISRTAVCECGDELRSDWSFCPSCGTRTPAADVLDPS